MSPLNKFALTLSALTAIALASQSQAGPRFASGDVTFSGTVQISETSRVSPNANSSSDTIYSFTPSIRYNRESARMNLNASLSAPFRRYDSNDSLDSNNIDFSVNGEIPFGANPRLSGSWNAQYFQGVRSSFLTNRNLDSETTSLSLNSNYRLRNKFSIRATASSQERSNSGIDSTFSNDNKTTSYSLGVQGHDLVGTIGGYVTYRVQKRETILGQINQAVDNKDDGLNFGLTGQILPERWFPQLDADLSFSFTSAEVGRNNRQNSNSDRNNRLVFNGRLGYPLNPKTNVSLSFSRNLDVTDDDRTVESTSINLSATYNPRPKLGLSASLGLRSSDFIFDTTARNDDALTASLSARYSIRQNWFASLSLNSRDSSSNLEISDYSSSVISLSSTIQY